MAVVKGGRTAEGTSAVIWKEISTSQTGVIDEGYLCSGAAQIVITLPTTAKVGETMRVAGRNDSGWRIAQPANVFISFGDLSTTAGTGGYLESTLNMDSVELVCITEDVEWIVASSIGNITVV